MINGALENQAQPDKPQIIDEHEQQVREKKI